MKRLALSNRTANLLRIRMCTEYERAQITVILANRLEFVEWSVKGRIYDTVSNCERSKAFLFLFEYDTTYIKLCLVYLLSGNMIIHMLNHASSYNYIPSSHANLSSTRTITAISNCKQLSSSRFIEELKHVRTNVNLFHIHAETFYFSMRFKRQNAATKWRIFLHIDETCIPMGLRWRRDAVNVPTHYKYHKTVKFVIGFTIRKVRCRQTTIIPLT